MRLLDADAMVKMGTKATAVVERRWTRREMITHRCEGSLASRVSIRYDYMSSISGWRDDFRAWRMFNYRYDYDYDVFVRNHVAIIKFCPFCGKKLEEVEDGKTD